MREKKTQRITSILNQVRVLVVVVVMCVRVGFGLTTANIELARNEMYKREGYINKQI